MSLRRDLARTAAFGALYLLATYAGRLTVLDDTNLSLIWPAAGVLAVWFVTGGTRRRRRLDVVTLAVITMVVNTATGASLGLAAVFVVANVVQGLVFVALLARWAPGLWRGGPDGRQLTRLAELWPLVAAAAISTAASAAIGPTACGWRPAGTRGPPPRLAGPQRGQHPARRGRAAPAGRAGPVAPTGTAAGRHRVRRRGRPLRGRLLLCVRCRRRSAARLRADQPHRVAGLRLHTTFVILHDLVFGAAAVLFTLHGTGPFAQIASHPGRALIAQLFVGTVAIVGLALALGRDERVALLDRLKASERAAIEQAQLLTTIIDSMDEGLGSSTTTAPSCCAIRRRRSCWAGPTPPPGYATARTTACSTPTAPRSARRRCRTGWRSPAPGSWPTTWSATPIRRPGG
jgi:hypothetical protein